MQIIRSLITNHLPFLLGSSLAVTLSLLFTWSPLLGSLVVGFAVLAVLTGLARIAGASSAHGLGAGHAVTASSWDDDLFTEPSPGSTSIEAIETVNVLRPNDLHVFGDGLLGGGGWDDDFSSCGAGASYPSFD